MPAKRGQPGPVTKGVASLLRSRLAELQWTQESLANKSGVSQSHMSQILLGNRHIYLDQLAGMCEAMQLDIGHVVGAAEGVESARRALLDQLDEKIRPPVHSRPDKDQPAESEADAS